MIEKDTIKELFSRTLENHTSPVRPEVWNGLQAKMAAAGVTSAGAAGAAKGLSALAKWLIGSAAVAGTAVVTTIAVVSTTETPKQQSPVKSETATPASQQDMEPVSAPSAEGRTSASAIRKPEQRFETVSFLPQVTMWDETPLAVHPPQTPEQENGTRPPDEPKVHVSETNGNRQGTAAENSGTGSDNRLDGNTDTQVQEKPYEPAVVSLPNVFTPNGDGDNKEYFIVARNVKSAEITILNEKNEVVFRSSDPNFRWDGTYNGAGEPVPNGRYGCLVVYKDLGGETKRAFTPLDVIR